MWHWLLSVMVEAELPHVGWGHLQPRFSSLHKEKHWQALLPVKQVDLSDRKVDHKDMM